MDLFSPLEILLATYLFTEGHNSRYFSPILQALPALGSSEGNYVDCVTLLERQTE